MKQRVTLSGIRCLGNSTLFLHETANRHLASSRTSRSCDFELSRCGYRIEVQNHRQALTEYQMDDSHSRRRFTVSELVVYVSLFGLVFSTIRGISHLEGYPGPFIEDLIVVIWLGVSFLLGALIGIGFAVLSAGRRHLMSGALIGGFVLLTLIGSLVLLSGTAVAPFIYTIS